MQVDQRLQLSIIYIPIHGCSLFCIESHTKSGASTLEEYMNFVLYRILRTYVYHSLVYFSSLPTHSIVSVLCTMQTGLQEDQLQLHDMTLLQINQPNQL